MCSIVLYHPFCVQSRHFFYPQCTINRHAACWKALPLQSLIRGCCGWPDPGIWLGRIAGDYNFTDLKIPENIIKPVFSFQSFLSEILFWWSLSMLFVSFSGRCLYPIRIKACIMSALIYVRIPYGVLIQLLTTKTYVFASKLPLKEMRSCLERCTV